MTTRITAYANALVGFINDTKPFHSKLSEIVEEYHFLEPVNVKITDSDHFNILNTGTWLYKEFVNTSNVIIIHGASVPFIREDSSNISEEVSQFRVNRDEVDIFNIPFCFDKRSFNDTSVALQKLDRADGSYKELLLEGYDFFTSRGGLQIEVRSQNTPEGIPPGDPIPLMFSYVHEHGELYAAVQHTQINQVQLLEPNSIRSRLTTIINAFKTAIVITVTPADYVDVTTELNLILAKMDLEILVKDFDDLLTAMNALTSPQKAALGAPYSTPSTFIESLQEFAPEIYFNEYSELDDVYGAEAVLVHDGKLQYDDIIKNVGGHTLSITTISSSYDAVTYETCQEWKLVPFSSTKYSLYGSTTGLYAVITFNTAITTGLNFSQDKIAFLIEVDSLGVDLLSFGEIVITPKNFVINPFKNVATGIIDTWDIIKVNPVSYTYPKLTSARIGYLKNLSNTRDKISILTDELLNGAIFMIAQTPTIFKITTNIDSYTANATVGSTFNDGILGFTIMGGTSPYKKGDKYAVYVTPPIVNFEGLSINYTFDTGPFDANEIVYNTISNAFPDYQTTLDFWFNSRFNEITEGLSENWINLSIAKKTTNGIWRLRAEPNYSTPLKLQSASPGNAVNIYAEDDPLNSAATYTFDSPANQVGSDPMTQTDPDTDTDLLLYYSNTFTLEYYDPDTNLWVEIDSEIPVSTTYTNATYDLAFNVPVLSKPYIASVVTQSYRDSSGVVHTNTLNGGDIIEWTVDNPGITTNVVGPLNDVNPALNIYGNSFHNTQDVNWTLTWTSAVNYTLVGRDFTNHLLFTEDLQSTKSYKNNEYSIHYTPLGVFAAGDVVTFTTFENVKPSFLVYSKELGYFDKAELDKWYYNGYLGFKFTSTKIEIFEDYNFRYRDLYWNNVIVAMHMDSITYEDLKGHTVTPSGSVAIATSSLYFGNAAAIFDGTSNCHLTVASTGFTGATDFEISFFLKVTSNANDHQTVLDFRTSGAGGHGVFIWIEYTGANPAIVVDSGNAGTWLVHLLTAFTANVKTYFTIGRTGDTWYLYKNGNLADSIVEAFVPDVNSSVRIGNSINDTWRLIGTIDDLRITQGADRHYGLQDFTVPTQAFSELYAYDGLLLDKIGTNVYDSFVGDITVRFLRYDLETTQYVLKCISNDWYLYEYGNLLAVSIFDSGSYYIDTDDIKLTLPLTDDNITFILEVKQGHNHMPFGHNEIIVNTFVYPADDDCLLSHKPKNDELLLSVSPISLDQESRLSILGLQNIDPTVIQYVENEALPDYNILNNWLPLLSQYQNGTSLRVFPDVATSIEYISPYTKERVGTLTSNYLTLDADFKAQYLDLNTPLSALLISSQTQELVKVNITESILILLNGNVNSAKVLLAEDYLRAEYLYSLSSRTGPEQTELDALLGEIAGYTDNTMDFLTFELYTTIVNGTPAPENVQDDISQSSSFGVRESISIMYSEVTSGGAGDSGVETSPTYVIIPTRLTTAYNSGFTYSTYDDTYIIPAGFNYVLVKKDLVTITSLKTWLPADPAPLAITYTTVGNFYKFTRYGGAESKLVLA